KHKRMIRWIFRGKSEDKAVDCVACSRLLGLACVACYRPRPGENADGSVSRTRDTGAAVAATAPPLHRFSQMGPQLLPRVPGSVLARSPDGLLSGGYQAAPRPCRLSRSADPPDSRFCILHLAGPADDPDRPRPRSPAAAAHEARPGRLRADPGDGA